MALHLEAAEALAIAKVSAFIYVEIKACPVSCIPVCASKCFCVHIEVSTHDMRNFTAKRQKRRDGCKAGRGKSSNGGASTVTLTRTCTDCSFCVHTPIP